MAERSLIYRISQTGSADVIRAIQSITAAARKAGADEAAVAAGVAQRRIATRRSGVDAETRSVYDLARKAERELKNEERATEKAAQARTRAALAEAKKREAQEQRAAKLAETNAAKEATAYEKAQAQKTRTLEREEAKRAQTAKRSAEETAKFIERAEMNSARQRLAENARTVREQERIATQTARDAMFDRKRLYRGVAGGIVSGGFGALGSVYGMAAGVGRSVYRGIGLQNAYDVGDIISERAFVGGKIRQIGIEQREAGKAYSFDDAAAMKTLQRAALRTGFGQRELVSALDVFSEKGLAGEGMKSIERVGVEAKAMGVDPAVVAKLRAQMMVSSVSHGEKLTEADLQRNIAQMVFMGKSGVFRAGAIAQESESLFSSYAASGGKFGAGGGFTSYIGFLQAARRGMGTGATTRTAVMSVMDVLHKNAKRKKIAGLGIDLMDEEGQERNWIDVTKDVIAKTHGRGVYGDIFDPKRSGAALREITGAFQLGYDRTKGTEKEREAAGRQTMEAFLAEQSAGAKGATAREVTKDFETRMSTSGAKFHGAIEKIRQTISDKLAPLLEKLANKMPGIVDKLLGLVDIIERHPVLATLGLMGAGAAKGAVGFGAKEVSKAGLRWVGDTLAGQGGKLGALGKVTSAAGNLVASATATHVWVDNWPAGFGGAGVPPVPGITPGAAPGVGSKIGKAALVAGAGFLGWEAGKAIAESDTFGSLIDWMGDTGALKDKLAPNDDAAGKTPEARLAKMGWMTRAAAWSGMNLLGMQASEFTEGTEKLMSHTLDDEGISSRLSKAASSAIKAAGTTDAAGAGEGHAKADTEAKKLAKTLTDVTNKLKALGSNISAIRNPPGRPGP